MNFNTPALLFGLILLVASIALFIFGRLKPEIQRDSDSVYAIIGVVCALILFGSAFDLSLGMSFQQLLMIGALIALMWENIQARQPKNMGARRGMLDGVRGWGSGRDTSRRDAPMVDDDRPVSRVYRAELEDLTLLEDQRAVTRRIRGERNGQDDDWAGTRRSSRASNNDYSDGYADSSRRSSNPRESFNEGRARSKRSERFLSGDRPDSTPSWDEDDKPVRRPRLNSADGAPRSSDAARPSAERPNSARSNSANSNPSRVERVRPPSSQRRSSEPSSDYVDYQPIDRPDSGNPREFE